MKLGYAGPQIGMTAAQLQAVTMAVCEMRPNEAHHGDCIGGDQQFDAICRGRFKRVAHPPINPEKRAWCDAEVIMPAKPYLERNTDVAQVDTLIATPRGYQEYTRSGTWSTVRRARKAGARIMLVLPDGTVRWEHHPHG